MAETYTTPSSGTAAQQERVVVTDSNTDVSLATLISGVVGDAQELVRKELTLAKEEFKTEVNKAKEGAISLGIGVGILAVGGLLLVLALVYGLSALTNLPLWASYLIVGGLFAIVGFFLLQRGRSRIAEVDPMPRQTIDSVQKDVETLVERK